MKKQVFLKVTSCLTLILSLFTVSCSNEESLEPSSPSETTADFEVSTMGKWASETRSAACDGEEPVLCFKSIDSYERIVEKLQKMTDSERIAFYQKIGFEGAYYLLDKATKELENIFEIEDSLTFAREVEKYMEKYKDVYSFENEEKEDITPHLKFKNQKNSFVANKDGFVVIGDNLISSDIAAKENLSNVKSGNNPPSEYEVDFQKVCELKNSHKKYRSIIYIGYDDNTKWCVAHFRSYKKVWFAEIQKNTRFFAYVTITSSTANETIVPKTYIFLPEGHFNFMLAPQSDFEAAVHYGLINPHDVDIKIEDFHSDLCPSNISYTFTNQIMYP